MISFAMAGSYL